MHDSTFPSHSSSSNEVEVLLENVKHVPDIVDTLIIGSIALDSISTIKSGVFMQDSNPGSTTNSIGGVGYNISLANWYVTDKGSKSRLVSFVGDDIQGRAILQELKELEFDTSGISVIEKGQTAQYTAIHDDKGELVVACADMSLIEADFVAVIEAQIKRAMPKTVVIDCNLSPKTIQGVIDFIEAEYSETTIIVDPTSAAKCTKLADFRSHRVFPHNAVKLVTPTTKELERIYEAYYEKQLFSDFDGWFPMLDSLGINSAFRERLFKYKQLRPLLEKGVIQQAFQLLPYFQNILVKLGANGALLVSILTDVTSYKLIPTTSPYAPAFIVTSEGRTVPDMGQMGVVLHYFPVPPEATDIEIVNVTGAGDSMLGYLSTTLSEYNWLSPSIESVEQEWMLWQAIHKSQLASSLSLQLNQAISPLLKQL